MTTTRKPTFVIAEIGVNHNGSESLALEMIDAAIATGADCVKFQTFSAELTVSAEAPTAAYQGANTGIANQRALLQSLELDLACYQRLRDRAESKGVEFMSTPFDLQSAILLKDLGVARMKIPSGEITNLPLIEKIAAFGLPVIISTGMSTLDEIGTAIDAIERGRRGAGLPQAGADDLTILHCTSSYPASLDDINLAAMQTIAAAFPFPVGYSDHSAGIEVAPLAVAAGGTMIEKHFTLDKSLPGPDHKASLEPHEFTAMIASIRLAERIMGSTQKAPVESEREVRNLVRRSLFFARDLPAGHALTEDDVVALRPGDGLPPGELPRLLGRTLARSVRRSERIASGDFAA